MNLYSNDCDTCSELVFRRRHGELSQEETETLDRHVAECEVCALFATEVAAALDLAADPDLPARTELELDARFGGVARRIRLLDVTDIPEPRTLRPPDPLPSRVGSGRTVKIVVASLAAVVVLLLLVGGVVLVFQQVRPNGLVERPEVGSDETEDEERAGGGVSDDLDDDLDEEEAALDEDEDESADEEEDEEPLEQEEAPTRLTKASIQSVIRRGYGQISRCRSMHEAEPGTMLTRFTIQPDGRVTNVTIMTETYRDTPVAECVEEWVSAMRFPPSSAPTTVNYPFILR